MSPTNLLRPTAFGGRRPEPEETLHPRAGLAKTADDEGEVAVLRMLVPERDDVLVAAQDVCEPRLDVREREALVGILDLDATVQSLAEGDRDPIVAEMGDERATRRGLGDEVE